MTSIPRTVVLTTDIFDEFMEDNDLYDFALSDLSDDEVLERFVQSKTPSRMRSFIREIVDFFQVTTGCPLIQPAGRQPLPAFCGGVLHLYDPQQSPGARSVHPAAGPGDQECICLRFSSAKARPILKLPAM